MFSSSRKSEAILQLFRIHWFLQLFILLQMGVVAFGFFVSPPYLFISSPSTHIGLFIGFTDWDYLRDGPKSYQLPHPFQLTLHCIIIPSEF